MEINPFADVNYMPTYKSYNMLIHHTVKQRMEYKTVGRQASALNSQYNNPLQFQVCSTQFHTAVLNLKWFQLKLQWVKPDSPGLNSCCSLACEVPGRTVIFLLLGNMSRFSIIMQGLLLLTIVALLSWRLSVLKSRLSNRCWKVMCLVWSHHVRSSALLSGSPTTWCDLWI